MDKEQLRHLGYKRALEAMSEGDFRLIGHLNIWRNTPDRVCQILGIGYDDFALHKHVLPAVDAYNETVASRLIARAASGIKQFSVLRDERQGDASVYEVEYFMGLLPRGQDKHQYIAVYRESCNDDGATESFVDGIYIDLEHFLYRFCRFVNYDHNDIRYLHIRRHPRINRGAPSVAGVMTEIIYSRHLSGEELQDLAEDYNLPEALIIEAIDFERAISNF